MLVRLTTALLLCAVLLSSCATTSTFAPQLSAPFSFWAAQADRFLGAYVEDAGFEKQIGREFSNQGTSQFLSRWQTFDEVFRDTYDQLRALNAAKPMMIGETASSELGGDKAAWIKDAFERLSQDYLQIRALVWFSINKETDWRIDSSPASLKAFTEAVGGLRWATAWPGFKSMP